MANVLLPSSEKGQYASGRANLQSCIYCHEVNAHSELVLSDILQKRQTLAWASTAHPLFILYFNKAQKVPFKP